MFKKTSDSANEPGAALLIAGTYEKAICGWELGKESSVTPVFQHPAHLAPIKAVASQGKFLVSGGNDEEIRIFNVRKRIEVGSLMKHQAPISTLRFSKKANSLISGSDDGMIAVWRIKDWECVSFKPAHKGSVIDLDVHPSGKVMLSCGRDNTLRLWDLTNAKELYCRAQKARGYGGFQQLRWRPRGDGFCYALANDVAVCDTESDEPIVRLSHPRPPFSFAFLSQHTVATGGEDKIVRVWDVRTGKMTSELSPFSSRIRSLIVEPITASLGVFGSNGDIALRKCNNLSKAFWQQSTNMRITCACTSSMLLASANGNGKEEEDEDEDEAEAEAEVRPGAAKSSTSDVKGKASSSNVKTLKAGAGKVYEELDDEVDVEEEHSVEEEEVSDEEGDDDGEEDVDVEEDEEEEEQDVDVVEEEEQEEAPSTSKKSRPSKPLPAGVGVGGRGVTLSGGGQVKGGAPRRGVEESHKSEAKKSPYRVFTSVDDLEGGGVTL